MPDAPALAPDFLALQELDAPDLPRPLILSIWDAKRRQCLVLAGHFACNPEKSIEMNANDRQLKIENRLKAKVQVNAAQVSIVLN